MKWLFLYICVLQKFLVFKKVLKVHFVHFPLDHHVHGIAIMKAALVAKRGKCSAKRRLLVLRIGDVWIVLMNLGDDFISFLSMFRCEYMVVSLKTSVHSQNKIYYLIEYCSISSAIR